MAAGAVALIHVALAGIQLGVSIAGVTFGSVSAAKLTDIDQRLSRQETWMEKMDGGIENVNKKLQTLDTKVEKADASSGKLCEYMRKVHEGNRIGEYLQKIHEGNRIGEYLQKVHEGNRIEKYLQKMNGVKIGIAPVDRE